MSESKDRQTYTSGEVYTHPRGKKYRDEYDRIFNKCKDCEDCKCQEDSRESSRGLSDA